MGISVTVIAGDLRLLDAVQTALASWCGDVVPGGDAAAITLELTLTPRPCEGVGFAVAVEGSRLTVGHDGFWGRADDDEARGWAQVPARLLDQPAALLGEIIEPLLLFLLSRRDRTPIHAAGVVIDGVALLLCGPSGMGKSTLARAAARRGHALLSDDTVYVQRRPKLAFWGLPRAIHILGDEAPAGDHPRRWRNGRDKAALPVPHPCLRAGRAVVVVLDRGEAVHLSSLSADAARAALIRLEPGFDLLREESAGAVEALLAEGGWRLTLSADPDAAIERLEALVATKPGCA